jgi:hypothetical protein
MLKVQIRFPFPATGKKVRRECIHVLFPLPPFPKGKGEQR